MVFVTQIGEVTLILGDQQQITSSFLEEQMFLGKREVTIALSSMETQYMASIQAMKDAIWFIRFLGEEGYKHEKPTLIFIDFQGNLVLLKSHAPFMHKNT
jgi:hypothetical protein